MSLRFCLVTTFFPPEHFGGDAIVVAQLANLLVTHGHQVDVIYCADAFRLLRGSVEPSRFQLHPAVRVNHLESNWGPLAPIATYVTGGPFGKALERLLDRGYDVIHWHNLSLLGGPGALPMGVGLKICTLHDYWLMCPTSMLLKFNRRVCHEPSCLACTLAAGRPPQLWRYSGFLQRCLSNVDLFLAPSRYVRDRFRASNTGIEAEVLPHFLADNQQAVRAARPAYYFFAGRLEWLKGLHTILPFFRDTGRRLKIAGAGSYEPQLRRLASGAPNIEFLGRVPHSHLPELYAGAIATLVPSVSEETFGLTILESLQQGAPPVVSNFGALPELVQAAGCGYVYQSVDELEGILQRLEQAASAIQVDLRPFSPEQHLSRYMGLIQSKREGIAAAVDSVRNVAVGD